jgi:colanic acid biosynthesis glycosyl transferase WcaI
MINLAPSAGADRRAFDLDKGLVLKILIHGINFAPELIGVGKYTGEMAAWLAGHGHAVRVVTAPPYYPGWRVGEGYSAARYRRESWSASGGAGAQVWRCPLWVPQQPGGLKRVAHLASFAASSAPIMLAQVRWRPDLVLVVEPTLLNAPAALATARLSGAKTWLHIQDLEVDAAFDMGLLPRGALRSAALAAERALLRGFDRVSTISEAMRERLIAKGVSAEKAPLFANWVDVDAISPLDRASTFRSQLDLAPHVCVALYAGNLGEKQGLEMLIEAARRLQHEPNLVFVIAGSGSARASLEAMGAGLGNLRWLPLQPAERLNDLLNLADIHLLPQRADAADLVMPSKLTGMLASGRPVVATAGQGTQLGRVVSGCGVLTPPGDGAALANAIAALVADPAQRRVLGRAARAYAEQHLARDAIMSRFENTALALCGRPFPAPKEPA